MWKDLGVASVAVLAVSGFAAGWTAGPSIEPSTSFDSAEYMWPSAPDAAVDRVYFSGHLNFWPAPAQPPALARQGAAVQPAVVYAEAYLGYWRDCNHDGAIGDLLTGRETYLALVAPTICPFGSPYFDGLEVKEFLWIGRGTEGPQTLSLDHVLAPLGAHEDPRDVVDQGSRVWADWGEPEDQPINAPRTVPFPRGTLDSTDGHFAYIDQLTGHTFSSHAAAGDVWPTTRSGGHNPASPVPNMADPVTRTVRDRYNDSQGNDGGRTIVEPWDWGTADDPDCDLLGPGDLWGLDLEGAAYPTLDHLYRSAVRECSRENGDKLPSIFPNLEAFFSSDVKRATDWSFFFFQAVRFNPSESGPGPDAWLCPVVEGYESIHDGCNAGWFAREHWPLVPAPYPGGNALRTIDITFYADSTVVPGIALPAGITDAHVYGSHECIDGLSSSWDCDPTKWASAQGGLGAEWKASVGDVYDLRDVDSFPALAEPGRP